MRKYFVVVLAFFTFCSNDASITTDLGIEKDKRKELVAFIIGGPNKYYKYSEKQIHELFNKVKTLFTPDKFKIIVIPSYRTPENVLKMAFNTFNADHPCVIDTYP